MQIAGLKRVKKILGTRIAVNIEEYKVVGNEIF